MADGSPAHRLARTLQDAREQAALRWPGRHASAIEFHAYHQNAAQLFQQVAQTDPGHKHEALYLAQQERETAQRFAALIDASTQTEGST